MNLERLNRLMAVLYSVPASPVAFAMDTWMSSQSSGSGCGTAACALGHAALDPWMQEQGLYLDAYWPGESIRVASAEQFNAFLRRRPPPVQGRALVAPMFDGLSGYDAGAQFFGISANAAAYLFDPNWYPAEDISAADVAERVAEVIALDGDAPYWAAERGYDDD